MLRRFLVKNRGWGLTILRVVVGIVFVMHGGQKIFVIGIQHVAGMFASLGIPEPLASAVVVSLVESLGGIALIVGLATRWAALLIAIDMVVAILKVHLPHGFFGPGGFEYPLTLLAANLALLVSGPGAAAMENRIGHRPL
jgi:putative oxidoreductase